MQNFGLEVWYTRVLARYRGTKQIRIEVSCHDATFIVIVMGGKRTKKQTTKKKQKIDEEKISRFDINIRAESAIIHICDLQWSSKINCILLEFP